MTQYLITCRWCAKRVSKPKKIYKYCSRSCQSFHLAYQGISCKKPKNGEEKNCLECGKEYYIPLYRSKKGSSRFCSRKCQGKRHMKERPYLLFCSTKSRTKIYKTITVNGTQVREHRYIMEQLIGRNLSRCEHVHHINGDHKDNRIENLQLLSNSDHQKIEVKRRIRNPKSIS